MIRVSVVVPRPAAGAQEGDAGHPADCAAHLPLPVHLQRVRLLRPAHRHLLLQPQAGVLQCQPQGGQLHVPAQLRGIPRQVRCRRFSQAVSFTVSGEDVRLLSRLYIIDVDIIYCICRDIFASLKKATCRF